MPLTNRRPGYSAATTVALLGVMPFKRQSHFFRGLAYLALLPAYNKALAHASSEKAVHMEDAINPIFTHQVSIKYSGPESVVPERDGKALAYGWHGIHGAFIPEMQSNATREAWQKAQPLLDSTTQACPTPLIKQLLDKIKDALWQRCRKAEEEMHKLGPVAHEILAGCHRQRLEFDELFGAYATQLADLPPVLAHETNIERVGAKSNRYYRLLFTPPMRVLCCLTVLPDSEDDEAGDGGSASAASTARTPKKPKTSGQGPGGAASSGAPPGGGAGPGIWSPQHPPPYSPMPWGAAASSMPPGAGVPPWLSPFYATQSTPLMAPPPFAPPGYVPPAGGAPGYGTQGPPSSSASGMTPHRT